MFDYKTAEPSQKNLFSYNHRIFHAFHKRFHYGCYRVLFYTGLLCYPVNNLCLCHGLIKMNDKIIHLPSGLTVTPVVALAESTEYTLQNLADNPKHHE